MSQVDEGLIHAWLDGQLSAADGARVEHLVATDAEWRDAVAEARGMIAGASRILGALDDVPAVGGMSGKGAAPRRVRSWWRTPWMALAATAVLAVGLAGALSKRGPVERAGSVVVDASRSPIAPAVPTAPANEARQATPLAPPATSRPAPVAAPAMTLAARPSGDSVSNALQKATERVAPKAMADAQSAAAAPPVVEQGVMGATIAKIDSVAKRADNAARQFAQASIDPRLTGCWIPVDSTAGAGARSTELGDSAIFVLRFAPATATDIAAPNGARAATGVGGGRGGRGVTVGGLAARLRSAPAGARTQYTTPRQTSDSTFVAEWIGGGGRMQISIAIRNDTIRGTSQLSSGDAVFQPRPFVAVKGACPPPS